MIGDKPSDHLEDRSEEWFADDESILDLVKKARKDSQGNVAKWVEEATDCFNFVAGKQYTVEEEAALDEQRRPAAALNWIARLINAVCGQQVANRQETRYLGRDETDFGSA